MLLSLVVHHFNILPSQIHKLDLPDFIGFGSLRVYCASTATPLR